MPLILQSPKDTDHDQTVTGIGSEVNLLQREYRDDVMDLYSCSLVNHNRVLFIY